MVQIEPVEVEPLWESIKMGGFHEGTLGGKRWQAVNLAELGYRHKWRDYELVTFVAVCLSECAGYEKAHCENYADEALTKLLSEDIGLMQINITTSTKIKPDHPLWNPDKNVAHARRMYESRGWQPWHGFTNNIAMNPDMKGKYIQRAIHGVANFYRRKANVPRIRWTET